MCGYGEMDPINEYWPTCSVTLPVSRMRWQWQY